MKLLKQAFDFLNKPAQERYNKKATAYLAKFKKSYEDRTVGEKILTECLYKIEVTQVMGPALTRYLGAMEATLVMEGHLEYAKPFEYQETKGLFGNTTETYGEVIVRKTKEFLTIKEVL
jgi:hypothetical protein